jgi:hypothetical protein
MIEGDDRTWPMGPGPGGVSSDYTVPVSCIVLVPDKFPRHRCMAVCSKEVRWCRPVHTSVREDTQRLDRNVRRDLVAMTQHRQHHLTKRHRWEAASRRLPVKSCR